MDTLCSPLSVTFVNTLTIEGIGYVLYPAVLIRCALFNMIGDIVNNGSLILDTLLIIITSYTWRLNLLFYRYSNVKIFMLEMSKCR